MRVADLFHVERGHKLYLKTTTPASGPEAVNYVSASGRNNGVSARVARVHGIEPAEAGTITVALDGSVLETFLQPAPFYASPLVAMLTPKRPMSDKEKLWWVFCIRAHKDQYNYGRKANRTHAELELPDVIPSWVTGVELPDFGSLRSAVVERPASLPDLVEWRSYAYGDIFEIVQGERRTKASLEPGMTRMVRASQFNNGVVGVFDLPASHRAGSISVPYNGSVAHAFYQPEPFFASDDVFVLNTKTPTSARVGLFLCAVIRLEQTNFGYGYKWNMNRMRKTTIRLPSCPDGTPDWDLMDRFVASLPFSAISEAPTVIPTTVPMTEHGDASVGGDPVHRLLDGNDERRVVRAREAPLPRGSF